MKETFITVLALATGLCAQAVEKLATEVSFDASKGVTDSVAVPLRGTVHYTVYTNLYYVSNVEDSTYQYLNLYVPDGASQQTPIFMPNNVGGYMAALPGTIDADAASGRALAEGFVVVMPGARGRNSTVKDKEGGTVYTGRAPKGLLDLKAAIRYLRHFDKEMPGDAEHIISDGTSAGGAMSALLGATGNHPDYEDLLKRMGAPDERDDIYAAVCFCPIIDLEHADMAYEWLYGVTNGVTRSITADQQEVSQRLADLYPDYLASLDLRNPEGKALTADNYRDYLKRLLIESAQYAKNAGADIPDTIGFTFSRSKHFQAPLNGRLGRPEGKLESKGMKPEGRPTGGMRPMGRARMGGAAKQGEYIVDLNLDKYLNYVVSTTPLKTPPAFDSQGVAGGKASGENEEFGDASGSSVNFTEFSLRLATGDEGAIVSDDIKQNVRMLNPMNYITDSNATVAQYWYIRHGARDRDTAFSVPINFALKLQNSGRLVDFKLPWNRPHSGDYALDELFTWIKSLGL